MENNQTNLASGKIGKQMARYAVPCVISLLVGALCCSPKPIAASGRARLLPPGSDLSEERLVLRGEMCYSIRVISESERKLEPCGFFRFFSQPSP